MTLTMAMPSVAPRAAVSLAKPFKTEMTLATAARASGDDATLVAAAMMVATT